MVRHVLSQATVAAPTKFESPLLGVINAVRSPAYPHRVLFSLCCTRAKVILKARCHDQVWWYKPLVLELGSQSQANLYEFQASLVYRKFQSSHGYIERPCL